MVANGRGGYRLALREEGDMWNAYMAPAGTMEGGILLGSVMLAAVRWERARKDGFIELMSAIFGDLVQFETGIRPVMGAPVTAPEHERAARAAPEPLATMRLVKIPGQI